MQTYRLAPSTALSSLLRLMSRLSRLPWPVRRRLSRLPRVPLLPLLAATLVGLHPTGPLAAQQPTLDPEAPPVFAQSDVDGISQRYAAVSLANALLGGLSAGVNLTSPGPRVGAAAPTGIRSHAITLGMSAGGASMALGVVGLVRGGDDRALGAANLVVGAASAWLAYRAATRRTTIELRPWIDRGRVGPERSVTRDRDGPGAESHAGPRAGFRVSVSF